MILKKTLFAFILLLQTYFINAQTTGIQFINNCPDQGLTGLTVYIDGTVAVPGLIFRNASPFITISAGVPVTISVSDMGGSINDTFFSVTTTLSTNPVIRYIAVANGIKSTSGYSPMTPFTLSFCNIGKEMSNLAGNTDILFGHGCTDAGKYDVRAGSQILADDISFGQFSQNYSEFTSSNYPFRLTNTTGSVVENTYETIFDSNPLYMNKTGVIILSGFKNPSLNSNGPSFGLWVANVNGGPMTELMTTNPEAIARFQLIHNSADTMADSVDIYINDKLAYDDFPFRNATPFIDLLGNTQTTISVATNTSTSITDTFYSFTAVLDSAKRYIATIKGVESPGYTPSPAVQPFSLSFLINAREAAAANSTDINILNASTDAPPFNVINGTDTLAKNLFFPNYSGYKSLSTTDYSFLVSKFGSNDTINRYFASLQSWALQGKAVTIMSSGFYDTAKNKLSPKFGLYLAVPEGGPMTQLPLNTTSVNKIALLEKTFTISPNPASHYLNINSLDDLSKANATIINIDGRIVQTFNTIKNKQINIEMLPSGTYILMLSIDNKNGYQKFIKQ